MNQHLLPLLVLLAFCGLAPGPAPAQVPDPALERPAEQDATTDSTNASRRGRNYRHSLGDLVVMGHDIVVKEDETARDVVVLGGSAEIDGRVTRDLVVVLGSSDEKGAFPKNTPKTPQDGLATLYQHLGIDTTAQYVNPAGRPIPVLPSGKPIEELG